MANRPRTNLVSYPSVVCCAPPVAIDCCNDLPLFGPTTGAVVGFHLEAGTCLHLTAFTLPAGARIDVFEVDGGDCGSGVRVPFIHCGAQLALTPTKPRAYVCGPGYFQLESTAAAGSVLVRGTGVSEDKVCCEQCPPVVSPQLINGSPSQSFSFFGGALTFTPSGDDSFTIVENQAALCAFILACAPTPAPAPQADVAITKTITPATFATGGPVVGTVVLVVSNNGPAPANGTIVTDNIA